MFSEVHWVIRVPGYLRFGQLSPSYPARYGMIIVWFMGCLYLVNFLVISNFWLLVDYNYQLVNFLIQGVVSLGFSLSLIARGMI